jgi:uncharacterized membrane protein
MSENAKKYNFVVIKYPGSESAQGALELVRLLVFEDIITVKDAVAITKSSKGKIKLHQTKDDTAGKGFLKGGLIGLIFAVLFGPAGWVVAGAILGTAFAIFDRGIKDKLLKELGESMSSDESALAVLAAAGDWDALHERLVIQNPQGVVVVAETVDEQLEVIEELVGKPEAVGVVPEEVEIPED